MAERAGRCTKVEQTRRMETLRSMLRQFVRPADIVAAMAQPPPAGWGIPETHVYKMIRKVRAELEPVDLNTIDRDAVRGRYVELLDDVIARGMASGNHAAVIMAVREVGKLLGLYAPVQHEISGRGGGPMELAVARMDMSRLTDAELDALDDLARKTIPALEPAVGAPANGAGSHGADSGGESAAER